MFAFIQALIYVRFDPREVVKLLGLKRQKLKEPIFPPKNEGQDIVEYALVVVLIAILVMAILTLFGVIGS